MANSTLHVRVANDDETPRLKVGTRRRGARDRNRLVYQRVRDGIARVVADCPACQHLPAKSAQPRPLLAECKALEREWNRSIGRFGHHASIMRYTPNRDVGS